MNSQTCHSARLGLALSLLLGITGHSQAATYFQDFTGSAVGATTFSGGSELVSSALGGAAQVVDATYKELQLTAAGTASTRSAFRLPSLDPTAPTYGFSAKWNATINGNFPNAAEGFSFNYGALGTGYLASPLDNQETGYGVGISFGVQTRSDNAPGFYLRVNGNIVAAVTNNPTLQWGVNNTTRHFFEVDWSLTNGATVRVDGQLIFSNIITVGFVPAADDRFVFGARTGGQAEEVRLDNILVVTGGNLLPIPTTSPYYADANSDNFAHGSSKAFDGDNSTYWITYASSGYIGASVAGGMPAVQAVVLSSSTETGGGSGTDLRDWTLQGSSNGGTNWTPCAIDSTRFVNRQESRTYLATNNSGYSAFRLNISQNLGGGGGTALGELRLYGFKPVSRPVGWQETPTYALQWKDIATSANGNTTVAAGGGDGVFISTNAGQTWTKANLGDSDWTAVACSSNGNVMVAAARYTNNDWQYSTWGIHISTNKGATWRKANVTDKLDWQSLTMSADGAVIYAGVNGGGVWVNSANNLPWSQTSVPAPASWRFLTTDAAGIANYFAMSSGTVYYYSYFTGVALLQSDLPAADWAGIRTSANGSATVAATRTGKVYRKNAGNPWVQLPASPPITNYLFQFTASADLQTLAFSYPSGIYVSYNGGTNWTSLPERFGFWNCLTISGDASHFYGPEFYSIFVYGPYPLLLPDVSTLAATETSPRNPQLNGQAVGNWLPASFYFQWGTTTNYGSTTAVQNAGSGIVPVSLSAGLSGLQPGTTYHYRAAAWNPIGIVYGADAAFTSDTVNHLNLLRPGDLVVPSSTNSLPGYGASLAIDGSAGAKYHNFDKTNTSLTFYPYYTNEPVRALGLISGNDLPERDPTSFALFGSTDGFNFTLIASNAIPFFADRMTIQSIAFANTNVYSIYRLVFPTIRDASTADSMQIAEIELLTQREISRATDNISGTGGIFDRPPERLLNRRLMDNEDYLYVEGVSAGVAIYETPANGASILKGIEIIGTGLGASYPYYEPVSVDVFGSTNGINYDLIESIAFHPAAIDWHIQNAFFANSTAYSSYRFNFSPPASYSTWALGELRLFGDTLASLSPRLSIARSGNSIQVSWPEAPDFTLEKNNQIAAPSWTAATDAIVLAEGTNTLNIAAGAPAEFFRLRK